MEFIKGDLVLLVNYILKLFLGKLWSRWSGPFGVKRVTPHKAMELWSESTGLFIVNGKILKHYISGGVKEK